jgi:hypothetical protein
MCFLFSSALALVTLPKIFQEDEEECQRVLQSYSDFIA